MLTETEKAYLAGFFDGDGCIIIGLHRSSKKNKQENYSLHATFSQSHQDILEYWHRKVGLGHVYKNPPMKLETKPGFYWRMTNRQAKTILELMLPYLMIKKEQAEIALRFAQTFGTSGRRLPKNILNLRKYYKRQLQALKHNKPQPNSEFDEYEELLESQLSLW